MSIVVPSSRYVKPIFSWRNAAPPLEDALAQFDDVTLVAPPAFRHPTLRAAMPAWLAAIKTVRRASVVYWNQLHLRPATSLWALAYTQPLARRAVFAIDAFEPVVPHLGRILDAQGVSRCFVCYREAAAMLARDFPQLATEWLPVGTALQVFHDLYVERDIFAFSMGRRHEPLHHALLDYCRSHGLEYRYSRHSRDPRTVDELNTLISRSRYFVVTPPDLDDKRRTGSFSPLTSRYLEGAAAGSRLLGVLPRSGELEDVLSADAIVECRPDGSDLEEVLTRSESDPLFEARRTQTRDNVQSHHGWDRRATIIHNRLQELQ